jgi:GNAT superfamily N-acetyltransferase
MLELRSITYEAIEEYEDDYCRRSGDFEMPEDCAYYGVFSDARLVAYFCVQDGQNDGIFIRRGYVIPGERRKGVWRISLRLLEQAARERGFKAIEFYSERNPQAYARMFRSEGYKPISATFIKRI